MPDDGFELNKEPQDSFSHLKVTALEEPILVRLSQMGVGTSGALGYTKIRNKRSPAESAGLTEGGSREGGRALRGASTGRFSKETHLHFILHLFLQLSIQPNSHDSRLTRAVP